MKWKFERGNKVEKSQKTSITKVQITIIMGYLLIWRQISHIQTNYADKKKILAAKDNFPCPR